MITHPGVMPSALSESLANIGQIQVRSRRVLALVPSVVAVRACCNHVSGFISSTLRSGDKVLGSASKIRSFESENSAKFYRR